MCVLIVRWTACDRCSPKHQKTRWIICALICGVTAQLGGYRDPVYAANHTFSVRPPDTLWWMGQKDGPVGTSETFTRQFWPNTQQLITLYFCRRVFFVELTLFCLIGWTLYAPFWQSSNKTFMVFNLWRIISVVTNQIGRFVTPVQPSNVVAGKRVAT